MLIDFTKMQDTTLEGSSTIDFSLMNKEMPENFMSDNMVPELAKASGDDPVKLKEKINSSNMYSDMSGLPFTQFYDVYDDLLKISPAFFDVDSYLRSSIKTDDPNIDQTLKDNFKKSAWHLARPFVSQGYTAASALNRGIAGFSQHLDSAAEFLEIIGVGEKGTIFENAAKMYEENAEYWAERADKVGVSFIDEMIGEGVGGAFPGIGSFVLDVSSLLTLPFMAETVEAEKRGEENPISAGLVAAAKTGTLHLLFKAIHPLKQYLKAPTMGIVFGFEEMAVAPEGEKAKAFAKGFGIGTGYSFASPGGHLGMNELVKNAKPYIDVATKIVANERGSIRIRSGEDIQWKTEDGKTITGKLVKKKGNEVIVETPTGKEESIPFEKIIPPKAEPVKKPKGIIETAKEIVDQKVTVDEFFKKKAIKPPTKKEKELLKAKEPSKAIKELAIEEKSKQVEKDIKKEQQYLKKLETQADAVIRGDLDAAKAVLASDVDPHIFSEKVIKKEIEIFERLTAGVIPKRKAKKAIRQQTGQIKIKDIQAVDTRVALKDQLKLEAKTAREAFRAGKIETALAAKQRALDLLIKNRQKKALSKMRKDLQKIHKNVKRGQQYSKSTQEALDSIFDSLDTTKITKKKRIKLQSTKEFLEKNEFNEIPHDVLKDMERLEKTAITELTFDEATQIYNAAKHRVKLEGLKNKLKVRGKLRDHYKSRKKMISEMKPSKEITQTIREQVQEAREKRTRADVAKKGIKEFLTIRQLGYDTMVEYVFGQGTTGYDVFFRQLKKGTRARLKHQHSMIDGFIKDIKPEKGFEDWLNEKPEIKGESFDLTRDERMSLYRHSLNPDNRRAIIEGGFGFISKPTKLFRMTEKQLTNIINSMSTSEKRIAGELATRVFDKQRDAMNEVFLNQNGFDMPVPDGIYMPKNVMSHFSKIEPKEFIMSDNMTRVGTPKGHTIKRIGSKAPIYLTGLTEVVQRSVKENSTYIGLEEATANASKMLYDKKFKLAMHDKYGDAVWREIEKGMRDIIGLDPQFNSFDKALMFIKSNMATGILGLNPFVVGIQPASFPGYGIYIEPKYITEAMGQYLKTPKEMATKHTKESPEYRERTQVGYNIDIQDIISKDKRMFADKKRLPERLMTPIQMADKIAVTPGTQAGVLKVLAEIKKGKLSDIVKISMDVTDAQVKKMTPGEQTALAYEFADFVTAKTQPMFSPEHRSSISRGSALERTMAMFGSYTSRAKDVMISTGLNYKQLKQLQKNSIASTKDVKSAKNQFAKAIFAVMVINTAAIMGRDEIRNKLYDRKSKLSFFSKVLKSWSGLMFGVRDVANAMFRAMDKGTSYGINVQTSPISEIPNALMETGLSIADALEGKEGAQIKAVDEMLNLILTGRYGLPYQPVKRLLKIGKKKKKRKSNL